jgi:hypothetical protein
VPYRDFPVEYPILALPFFVLPKLVAGGYSAYKLAFALEMLVANAIAVTLLLYRLPSASRLLWYTGAFAAFCPLLLTRFDLLVMAWAFAALVAWQSGRPFLGGFLAGSGAMLKIVPGLAALGMGDREKLRPTLAGLSLALVSGLALWLGLGGEGVLRSFLYHAERGLEVESTYGGLAGLAALHWDLPHSWAYLHKSVEIQTPWSAGMSRLATLLQPLALCMVAWRAYRGGPDDSLRFVAAGILGFVIFGKVLSPQYLIWLLPFVAALSGRRGAVSRGLFLAASLMTSFLYPHHFSWFAEFRPEAFVILNLRNLLLLGLWIYWLAPETGKVLGVERPVTVHFRNLGRAQPGRGALEGA